MKSLAIFAGSQAAARLASEGWHPELFDTLIGASGGPKWLVLSALDRMLHHYLLAPRVRPLDLVASSIGSWRHACLSLPDAATAIARFEDAYVAQSYSERPSPSEVSQVATEILHTVLGTEGALQVAHHDRLRNHIVTARAQGVAVATSRTGIGFGMGAAGLLNAVHRPLLSHCFSRVVFSASHAPIPDLLRGFATSQVSLSPGNVVSALKASGAIPLVLEPERAIAGAPPGNYWDGGIIDYHFELPTDSDRLMLYPHFTDSLTAGWFDKFLPWRAGRAATPDNLVLLCPSQEFVASLPFGKIPDRRDFQRLPPDERRRYWRHVLSASCALADEFATLFEARDPLAGVRRFPAPH